MDITLIRRNRTIITKWYKKPISKDLLINYYSWHPRRYKMNILNNLMLRAIRLTDLRLMSGIRAKVYSILSANWYPFDTIDNEWKKCMSRVYGNKRNSEKQINDCKTLKWEYRSLDYVDNLSECINSILMNQGFRELRLPYKPRNKINLFVHSMKDPVIKERQKDVIYKVSCKDCQSVYIGHTSMWISRRMYHHKMNTKTNTALSLHCLQKQHSSDLEKVEVLHLERKTEKRRILEAIYIRKNLEVAMNDRNEIGVVGSAYAALIDKL